MEEVGSIAFKGDRFNEGYFNLRQQASVLLGLDEVFRYFITKYNPELSKVDFEIPVKTKKGSWEAVILGLAERMLNNPLSTTAILGLSLYGKEAVKTVAKNDFKDLTSREILNKIANGLKWIVGLGKHTGDLTNKIFENVKFKKIDGEDFIGIPNNDGEIFYIPKFYLKWYVDMPINKLTKLVKPLENKETIEINAKNTDDDPKNNNDKVIIGYNDKKIFLHQEEDEDIVLPELVHGNSVNLLGHITRGNENTNTIGFRYNGHILTCSPVKGNINKDKLDFFEDCYIEGVVHRVDKDGNYIKKRPKIIYNNITKKDLIDNILNL